MRTLTLASVVAAALALSAVATAQKAPTVTAHRSNYGKVIFDGRGFVLYAFTKDGHGPSKCGGGCAKVWPPYVVSSPAHAATGAKSALLGTVRRSDGKLQVTYGGRPLYYYVGDRKPGQILCQNVSEFGGLWLVLRSDGRLVR